MAEVMIFPANNIEEVQVFEFSIFHDPKKQKYLQRKQEKKNCPHLVGGERAYRLQKQLDIENLAMTLLSEQSKILQRDGWKYDRVLRKGRRRHDLERPDREYCTLDVIDNAWKDQLLFSREKTLDE